MHHFVTDEKVNFFKDYFLWIIITIAGVALIVVAGKLL